MLTTIIAALAGVSGILLGWHGKTRAYREDITKEVTADASLQTDVSYIKRGIDDIRVDLRMQGQRMDGLAERVTRVEESSKQAHRRIDRIEEN
ncbi:hypothetical protein ABDI30_11220 [Paenibacillus cisolokensis]|uniref:hypothetical protein n=1 Tax=Paenibacillus cisolokensis TaxID=1658519 RepID=UPI003D29F38F